MAKKETKVKRATGNEQIVINQITITQLQRGQQDIQKWITAVRAAESVRMPNRRPLYNTFLDISIDLHLDAMIDKRIRALKTTPFEWEGLDNELIEENFRQEWFLHMLENIGMSFFWGASLMEVKLSSWDGLIEDMNLIPRQNVRPEREVIMLDGYTEDSGIRYKEGIYQNYIIQFRRNNDLGKFTKIAPYVLMKRSNLSDFSRYNEMFGIPPRVYKYDPNSPTSRTEVEKAAEAHGTAAYILMPEGMGSVELVQSNNSGTAMAFDKFHEIMNKEITVGVLGQTLTTGGEKGGSYELGKVHQYAESEINLEDRLYAEYLINYPFRKNILIPHGYPLQDVKGKFKVVDELPKEMKANMWSMLADKGLPIAKEDFYTEFGIPHPDDREVLEISSSNNEPPPTPEPPTDNPPPEPPVPPKGGGKKPAAPKKD